MSSFNFYDPSWKTVSNPNLMPVAMVIRDSPTGSGYHILNKNDLGGITVSGDLEIGAVEIKDASTDTRASIVSTTPGGSANGIVVRIAGTGNVQGNIFLQDPTSLVQAAITSENRLKTESKPYKVSTALFYNTIVANGDALTANINRIYAKIQNINTGILYVHEATAASAALFTEILPADTAVDAGNSPAQYFYTTGIISVSGINNVKCRVTEYQ